MKKKKKNKPATVTDLQELRELDAFISAYGGLAPGRWRDRWPSPSPPPPSPRKLTRAEREANSRRQSAWPSTTHASLLSLAKLMAAALTEVYGIESSRVLIAAVARVLGDGDAV